MYRDWRGRFYPDDLSTRRWLAYYATKFDTVELNSTFYRLPTTKAVDAWRDQAPPGFLYAVKLGSFGSHRMKLKDPARWLANHLDRVGRLGPTLGPNLVQLPPRWKRNAARLDEFLASTPRSMRWAVELRDPSWLHDEVFAVLARHGAALCLHDLLADHPWELTTDWTYVRFHGPAALADRYRGRYGTARLRRSAERLAPWLEQGHDVYAYFNNDYHADAVADATDLRELLAPSGTVTPA
jgi:uncharacterized protein YecE (DUF72 family)